MSRVSSLTSTATSILEYQMSILFVLVIFNLFAKVEGTLALLPVDTIAIRGETATLNCSTTLQTPVYWARTPVGEHRQHWLYYGKNGFNWNTADNRFTMDKDESSGRYNLVISNVELSDAGQYVCVDESGLGMTASVELVITNGINADADIPVDGVMGPNIFELHQQPIRMSCNLTYRGNIAPTITWIWMGSEIQSDVPVVSASNNTSATSVIMLFPRKEHNDETFSCRVTMRRKTNSSSSIRGLQWVSNTITVKYAEFENKEVAQCPGVKWNLVCNPPCSYSFETTDAGTCQCRYTYQEDGNSPGHNVTSDAIPCTTNVYKLPPWFIIFGVTTASVFLTAAVTAFGVITYQKSKKQKSLFKASPSKESKLFIPLSSSNEDHSSKQITVDENNES